MKNEKQTTTPLQSATDDLETARIALIGKLAGEDAANKQDLAARRQEVKDLHSKRAELTQKFNHSEAQKVSEKIPAILATIKDCETRAAELEIKLKNAREGRSPELQALAFKATHELQNSTAQSRQAQHDAVTNLITDKLREAVGAIAANNTDHARRILLAEFAL